MFIWQRLICEGAGFSVPAGLDRVWHRAYNGLTDEGLEYDLGRSRVTARGLPSFLRAARCRGNSDAGWPRATRPCAGAGDRFRPPREKHGAALAAP